ncbi:MAG: ATP phosphoribosyltransferase regulatory subunit [Oscillospiraceae bacterium]
MNDYIYKTPDGTRDFLFEECEIHNHVKLALSGVFKSRGYQEVITPALENYDLFSLQSAGLLQEDMYKLVDGKGHLLVLRPDITMPIARLASTRLKDEELPIRLFYNQRVFRVNQSFKGKRNEINQSGVELIGAEGLLADLEILTMAIESLRACKVKDFTIEIGHAGIFKKLAEALPATIAVKERIRAYIENKNYSALEDELDRLEESRTVNALKNLPRMFGGNEVLEMLEALCGDIVCDEISALNNLLNALNPVYGDKIRLDLGLVHRNNYYTGMVFQGYTKGSGESVVSGGRYDKLFSEFGKDIPAIGFAVNTDFLYDQLTTEIKKSDLLIFAVKGAEMQALEYMNSQIEKGNTCEIMPYKSDEQVENTIKKRGVKKYIVIGRVS